MVMLTATAALAAVSIFLATGPSRTLSVDNGTPQFDPCTDQAYYCLLADTSRSIEENEWSELTHVVRSIATGYDIGPGANESKVALVKFGSTIEREFGFSNNTDKATVLDAISSSARIESQEGGTATPDAILECLNIFEEQAQIGVPQVIMVFTDSVTHYPGESDQYDQQRLDEAVNMTIAAGTINFAVVFTGKEQERAQMDSVTIAQGMEERAFFNSSLEALEREVINELSCVCVDNGTAYAVGDRIPSDDPCLECLCVADEIISCTNRSATCPPPLFCLLGIIKAVTLPGECCPTYTCGEFCTDSNGTTYPVGATIPTDNPCQECTCGENLFTTCSFSCPIPSPTPCPPGTDAEIVNLPDECCPVYKCIGFCTPTDPCQNGGVCDEIADNCTCPTGYSGDLCNESCTDNGTTYAVGDRIPSDDPCVDCMCNENQVISCTSRSLSCPPPLCLSGVVAEVVIIPGECCPMVICNELVCFHNGTTYVIGDIIPTDNPCEECICSGQLGVNCSLGCPYPPPSCPPGTEVEEVHLPGECCPVYDCTELFCTPTDPCQNGGVCDEIADNCTCPLGYSGDLCNESAVCTDNGTTYAVGDSVPSDDPCLDCMCFENGIVSCSPVICLPPLCPFDTTVVAVDPASGECCTTYLCIEFICTDNGSIYPVGAAIPSDDPCEECTCVGSQSIFCTALELCPPPPSNSCPPGTDVEEVNIPGECCPMYNCTELFCTPTDPCQNGGICDEIADNCTCPPGYSGDLCNEFCTGSNGTTYPVGATVPSDNPCEECTCIGHESLDCLDPELCLTPPSCPPGTDVEIVHLPGVCCPLYNCTELFCTPTNPCQNGGDCIERADGCICPPGYSGDLCNEFCIDSGTVYALGASIPSDDPCQICVCRTNQTVHCLNQSTICSDRPLCLPGAVLEVLPGECCPTYECVPMCTDDNGNTYPVGATVPTDNPCDECICDVSGRIVCSSCPPLLDLSCPPDTLTVITPDECCPLLFCIRESIAVTLNRVVEGLVTQTLTIQCEAQGTEEDTALTFTWKDGDDVLKMSAESVVLGRASSVLAIRDLSMEDDGRIIQCHPNNSFGGYNFTEFVLTVQQFPAPDILSFDFSLTDNEGQVNVSPINFTDHLDASFDGYYYEISTNRSGSDIVANGTAAADDLSVVFPEGLSGEYWVRIRAVKGDEAVSGFSDWFAIDVVAPPAAEGQPALEAWEIALIVLFPVLFLCLLCFAVFCIIPLLCFIRSRKGGHPVEMTENKMEMEMATKS